jgi:hypothetical protein
MFYGQLATRNWGTFGILRGRPMLTRGYQSRLVRRNGTWNGGGIVGTGVRLGVVGAGTFERVPWTRRLRRKKATSPLKAAYNSPNTIV